MSLVIENEHMALTQDEAALSLLEITRASKVSDAGYRRMQYIRVIRNDRVVTFGRDLGRADLFSADQFYLVGGVITTMSGRVTAVPEKINYFDVRKIESLYTVGQLLGIAESMRSEKSAIGMFPQRDLAGLLIEKIEEDWKRKRSLSTFGYGGAKMRNR